MVLIKIKSKIPSPPVYLVTVERAGKPDASLSGIVLSDGSFSTEAGRETLRHRIDVGSETNFFTVSPMCEESTVRVNGKIVPSGSASKEIALESGENIIKIEAGRSYDITVVRSTKNEK
jgi:hypothetical protein